MNRVFPDLIKVRDEVGEILIMDRIRVTESGVVDGSGPAAEMARSVYEEFKSQNQETLPPPAFVPNESSKKVGRLRCEHCGLLLTGRIYRRKVAGSVLFFCCKACAEHHQIELVKGNSGEPIA